MKTIPELLARAAALRDETALNSINPERAGGIMYDTLLALNELWLQQGAALVISKIYASVAAMEADTAPVSDLTGKPLRPGQIVVIASSDSDNGSVYRYNGTESPSWSLVGSIGNLDPVDSLDSDSATLPLAAHQGKVLDGKISQLGQEVTGIIGGRELLSGWTNAAYILTNQGVGNVCNKSIVLNQPSYRTIIVNIPQNVESFIINGTGGATPRLWCFLDENDIILSVANINASGSGDALTINVPDGATQLIINSSTSEDCYAYSSGILQSLQENINNLRDEMEESQEDNEHRFNSLEYSLDTEKPYNLINQVGMNWVPGTIRPNGNIVSATNYVISDYIPIEPSHGYIFLGMRTTVQYYEEETQQQILNAGVFLHQQYCCFFDKNKDVIVTTINSNPSKQIPENAAFIRVTAQAAYFNFTCLVYGNYNEQIIGRVVDYRLTLPNEFKFSNTGYENFRMVAFGDSLTHGRFSEDTGQPFESWPDFANDELRGNIINCGFGGTRMMGTNLFSFISLCKTLVSEASDKWAAYDTYVSEHTEFAYNLTTLKGINWEEIDAISIWYGANDFPNNAPIGSSYNEDENTFDGACAAGIKLLLQKYPHLQILILSPIWGIRGGLNVDTEANGAGFVMIDYVNSLKRISDIMHCPVVDLYHTIQFNDINKLVYSTDATHIRSLVGFKRLSHIIAEQIKLYITPKYI